MGSMTSRSTRVTFQGMMAWAFSESSRLSLNFTPQVSQRSMVFWVDWE